ncbi:sensor histidine kinase [Roseovarius rhodophyticola]|uniref:histidine kinase n=1 Tax=Roseovarius rhodophyticola TaxID=3080827 RepID=A0ABZ2TCL2_9RHOB
MALAIRLALYGVSFVIIVVRDLWVERPPLTSELWLHFFTVIFVMYFLIDCSIVFLKLYRKNLAHLNKLHKEHERTKAAYKIKSQFVSTVSHELRTPLTSIKVSLDLLNTGALGPIPANMQTIVETAGKNSDRLSRLIDDVLDLQKLEAGEMTYRMEVLNVQVFLTDAVEGNAGFADMHRVTLMPEFDEKPWLFVEADEMRLMQVLSNVISNAVKFSNQGDIVTVGCMTLDSRVRIYVQDRGKGIPQGSEEKVFGRFSQIDSSDRRQVGGTGLGMNISREIVEHFKGTLTYESSEGQGTTFFIDLPLR